MRQVPSDGAFATEHIAHKIDTHDEILFR
jgi:hypothetical protein